MTRTEELAARWSAVMMGNYKTPPVALARGEGATVWDVDSREYTDLLGGIATTILGHAHPKVVEAITVQAHKLGHVSNLAMHEPGLTLAERLLDLAGRPGRVFFCNSGAEANEAAFKISRLTGRPEVITAEGAFHGRTMGALALTGQPSKAAAFAPLPGGVRYVPYGDDDALADAVGEQTAMVLLEPMLGEGGVLPAPAGYLAAAASAASDAGALFAVDEVQTGIGRTGSWFMHQADGVAPDVITLAKALGGGLPMGAMLAFGDAADLLQRRLARLDLRRQPDRGGRGPGGARHDPRRGAAGAGQGDRAPVHRRHRGPRPPRHQRRARPGCAAGRRPDRRRRPARWRRSCAAAGFLTNAVAPGRAPPRAAPGPHGRADRRLRAPRCPLRPRLHCDGDDPQ